MAQIELLQVGCTGQQLIDAVNALIAAHNDGESVATISYDDLADKPQINGVELKGNKSTAALLIALAGCSDYETLIATLATKSYADAAKTSAVAAAEAATQSALASKLNADLSNIDAIDAFPGDAYIPVVTGSGVGKTTLNNVASFTEKRAISSRSELSSAVAEQQKVLTLTGDKNGSNVTFACASGYTLRTSRLYLNGQLLTLGTDYTETSSYQIVMLTHVPVSTDVMTFMAVPLNS